MITVTNIFLILLILLVFVLFLYLFLFNKNKQNQLTKCDVEQQQRELLSVQKENYQTEKTYKGLCIFDIDGTLTGNLTNKKLNEKIVQIFLDNNYAVGISTAGYMYTPENIIQFDWMPENLYIFMKENNFNSFNNVTRGTLCGVENPTQFKQIIDYCSSINMDKYLVYGFLKGFTMEETAKKYNISNLQNTILYDDQIGFLKGVNKYNPNYTLICAGENCGGYLDIDLANILAKR